MPTAVVPGVSASTMFAPGAIACATSTSSVVSPALTTIRLFDPLNGGTFPAGWTIRNDGGAGSPNARSNTPRSCRMVGDPNGSAITIVLPLPLSPRAYSGGRSYARRS
jgi:hypothetical protein